MISVQEVLDALDRNYCDYNGCFEPDINPLDTYFRVADTRMTVFRSVRQWIVFFEFVRYNVGADEYEVSFYAHGNCINFGGYFVEVSDQMVSHLRHPFEFDEATTPVDPETDTWIFNRDRFSIRLNGRLLAFTPTLEDYTAAGIAFDEEPQGPDTIQPEQLLRFLCHRRDHPFFNSEDYLRSIVDDIEVRPEKPVFRQTGLSHHLRLFLQTREWQHTDFGERPSNVEGLRVLARVIASGDLTEWNAQNPATFNTGWRHWKAIRIAEWAQLREQQEQVAGGNWQSADGSYSGAVTHSVVESVESPDDEAEL